MHLSRTDLRAQFDANIVPILPNEPINPHDYAGINARPYAAHSHGGTLFIIQHIFAVTRTCIAQHRTVCFYTRTYDAISDPRVSNF